MLDISCRMPKGCRLLTAQPCPRVRCDVADRPGSMGAVFGGEFRLVLEARPQYPALLIPFRQADAFHVACVRVGRHPSLPDRDCNHPEVRDIDTDLHVAVLAFGIMRANVFATVVIAEYKHTLFPELDVEINTERRATGQAIDRWLQRTGPPSPGQPTSTPASGRPARHAGCGGIHRPRSKPESGSGHRRRGRH